MSGVAGPKTVVVSKSCTKIAIILLNTGQNTSQISQNTCKRAGGRLNVNNARPLSWMRCDWWAFLRARTKERFELTVGVSREFDSPSAPGGEMGTVSSCANFSYRSPDAFFYNYFNFARETNPSQFLLFARFLKLPPFSSRSSGEVGVSHAAFVVVVVSRHENYCSTS
jgi:hypothetical protein